MKKITAVLSDSVRLTFKCQSSRESFVSSYETLGAWNQFTLLRLQELFSSIVIFPNLCNKAIKSCPKYLTQYRSLTQFVQSICKEYWYL